MSTARAAFNFKGENSVLKVENNDRKSLYLFCDEPTNSLVIRIYLNSFRFENVNASSLPRSRNLSIFKPRTMLTSNRLPIQNLESRFVL